MISTIGTFVEKGRGPVTHWDPYTPWERLPKWARVPPPNASGWSESLPARSFTGENSAPWPGARNNRAENSHQAVPTTRAQNATVQVNSLRPAVSQRARCRLQHLQPSTPSRLALAAPDLPSGGGEPMAGCGHSRMLMHPASDSIRSPQVKLTMPRDRHEISCPDRLLDK